MRTNADRPEWDEYFMSQAYLAATRSSCLKINTGAVIVKDKRVIAMGYNGAPSGIENSVKLGFCNKEKHGVDFDQKGTGTCIGEHAERNAMSEIARKELEDSILYTVYYPCSPCSKTIAGNKISKVFYSKIYKEKDSLAEEIFERKKIEVIKLEIDFEKIYRMISILK